MAARRTTSPAPEAEANKTTLDSDTSRPQETAPGDAPHDTTDPTERAMSAPTDKRSAAEAGYGVVNAVTPLPDPHAGVITAAAADAEGSEARVEEYQVVAPGGKTVTVTHNLDTGESNVS